MLIYGRRKQSKRMHHSRSTDCWDAFRLRTVCWANKFYSPHLVQLVPSNHWTRKLLFPRSIVIGHCWVNTWQLDGGYQQDQPADRPKNCPDSGIANNILVCVGLADVRWTSQPANQPTDRALQFPIVVPSHCCVALV